MNKHLDEAIARVKALPDERQQEIAELILEILADETSRQVKAGLSADVAALYPSLGAAAR